MDEIKRAYDKATAEAFAFATSLYPEATMAQIKRVNYLTGIAHGMKMVIDKLEGKENEI